MCYLVRSHLTDTTADHIPFQIIVGTITLQGEAAKRQFQLGHSAYMIDEFDDVGEHIRCFVGLDRIADDGQSADFYWLLHQRGEPVIDLDSQSILDIVKRKISRWEDGAWCKALSESTKESILQPPLAVRDIQLPDLPACRVTLLGDAAHAMAPCKCCYSPRTDFDQVCDCLCTSFVFCLNLNANFSIPSSWRRSCSCYERCNQFG